MIKFIYKCLLIPFAVCMSSIYCNDTYRLINKLIKLGEYQYSFSQLPSQYCPPGSSITLFLSPGIRTYFCQPPSSVTDTNTCISVIINNRFGSRFCNQHNGQLILNIVSYHLVSQNKIKWLQKINLVNSSATYYVTTTSSGICIKVLSPTSSFSSAMAFIVSIINDIYMTTLTDSAFDSACTSLSQTINTSIMYSNTTIHNTLIEEIVRPKWDCTHRYASRQLGSDFGLPLGSIDQYSYINLTSMPGKQTEREKAKLCLALLNREKDFSIFITSQDSRILSQIPYEMKNLFTQFSTVQTQIFNKLYYGYVVPKNGLLSFTKINSTTPNLCATGGTIFLGPISAYSTIAAHMISKLTYDNTIPYSTNTTNISIIPYAGQITLRVSSLFYNTTDAINCMSSYITNLQARYMNSNNTQDFIDTNFHNLIGSAYNMFLPSSSTSTTSNINEVLTYDTSGYTNWMQLFQGAMTILYDLYNIKEGTISDKANAINQAANIIANIQNGYCEMRYLPI